LTERDGVREKEKLAARENKKIVKKLLDKIAEGIRLEIV
jgi:hypothetical protein